MLVKVRFFNVLINFYLCRDFAYVARDKDTRILKCHVFRCDTPAKAIATSLHEICSKVRWCRVQWPILRPHGLSSGGDGKGQEGAHRAQGEADRLLV